MRVVRATDEHIDDARRWAGARGYEIPRGMFSSLGFAVPNLAAWWLYLTDSSLAYCEFLVGNPDAPADVRGYALDVVIQRVLSEAAERGVQRLLLPVELPVVAERLERLGAGTAAGSLKLMFVDFQPHQDRTSTCPSQL